MKGQAKIWSRFLDLASKDDDSYSLFSNKQEKERKFKQRIRPEEVKIFKVEPSEDQVNLEELIYQNISQLLNDNLPVIIGKDNSSVILSTQSVLPNEIASSTVATAVELPVSKYNDKQNDTNNLTAQVQPNHQEALNNNFSVQNMLLLNRSSLHITKLDKSSEPSNTENGTFNKDKLRLQDLNNITENLDNIKQFDSNYHFTVSVNKEITKLVTPTGGSAKNIESNSSLESIDGNPLYQIDNESREQEISGGAEKEKPRPEEIKDINNVNDIVENEPTVGKDVKTPEEQNSLVHNEAKEQEKSGSAKQEISRPKEIKDTDNVDQNEPKVGKDVEIPKEQNSFIDNEAKEQERSGSFEQEISRPDEIKETNNVNGKVDQSEPVVGNNVETPKEQKSSHQVQVAPDGDVLDNNTKIEDNHGSDSELMNDYETNSLKDEKFMQIEKDPGSKLTNHDVKASNYTLKPSLTNNSNLEMILKNNSTVSNLTDDILRVPAPSKLNATDTVKSSPGKPQLSVKNTGLSSNTEGLNITRANNTSELQKQNGVTRNFNKLQQNNDNVSISQIKIGNNTNTPKNMSKLILKANLTRNNEDFKENLALLTTPVYISDISNFFPTLANNTTRAVLKQSNLTMLKTEPKSSIRNGTKTPVKIQEDIKKLPKSKEMVFDQRDALKTTSNLNPRGMIEDENPKSNNPFYDEPEPVLKDLDKDPIDDNMADVLNTMIGRKGSNNLNWKEGKETPHASFKNLNHIKHDENLNLQPKIPSSKFMGHFDKTIHLKEDKVKKKLHI